MLDGAFSRNEILGQGIMVIAQAMSSPCNKDNFTATWNYHLRPSMIGRLCN